MSRRFDLLIFDWDGTLADSAAQIVSGFQHAIASLKLPARSDAQIRELIGLGFHDAMGRPMMPDIYPKPAAKAPARYADLILHAISVTGDATARRSSRRPS